MYRFCIVLKIAIIYVVAVSALLHRSGLLLRARTRSNDLVRRHAATSHFALAELKAKHLIEGTVVAL